MRTLFSAFGLIALLATSLDGLAAEKPARDLLNECQGGTGWEDAKTGKPIPVPPGGHVRLSGGEITRYEAFCRGYVWGVIDMALRGSERTFCPTPHLTYDDAQKAFERWGVRNPDAADKALALDGILMALEEAWPCTNTGPK
jgi:Ssp1 endopeptidase immunity protein Rap1a